MNKSDIKIKADNAYVEYARLSSKGSNQGPNYNPKDGPYDIEREAYKENALVAHGKHIAYMDIYNNFASECCLQCQWYNGIKCQLPEIKQDSIGNIIKES